MKFTLRDYKIFKTKKYIKTTFFFFFFSGLTLNSKNWIKTKQKFKKIGFNYYKVFNRTSAEIVENSIYKNARPMVSGITFFVKSERNQQISKKILLDELKKSMFTFLAAKLNNKIYSLSQVNSINIFIYYKNKLLLSQFLITYLKSHI